MKRKLIDLQPLHVPIVDSYVKEDDSDFFVHIYGRRLNKLNTRYKLPMDADEKLRFNRLHRLMQFLYGGFNYIGPVQTVLSRNYGRRTMRVMDIGTGSGDWAIQIAEEFPSAEVIGVDLAPIQPQFVPENCSFEIFDFEDRKWPYPNNFIDVAHARFMYTGIHDYDHFLSEVHRILRPGGMILLEEMDTEPIIDGKSESEGVKFGHTTGMPAWCRFWNAYRNCESQNGIVVEPSQLHNYVRDANLFHEIVAQYYDVPIGFWPKNDRELSMGQLNWLAHDSLLPALEPLFRLSGYTEAQFRQLLTNAQLELYDPILPLSNRVYMVYAIRRT